MSPTSLRIVAFGLLLGPLPASAQTALPKQSPFAAAGGGPAATAGSDEALEFAGVSAMGKKTDVIIHDKTTKRKHWIGVGETIDGISVVKYDPAREQAVVRVNGAEKVLTLRKPTRAAQPPGQVQAAPVTFNVPAPVVPAATVPAEPVVQKIQPPPPAEAAPPVQAPATPQTPEAQAKAETEARMLVSDLLEIGMAQRKAYEEAQRNAAGRGSEQPIPPPQNQPPGTSQPPAQVDATHPAPPSPGQPGND